MSQHFHFISELSRFGSTFLAALLSQNPRFRVGMISPVGALFTSMLNQFNAGSAFGPAIEREQLRRLLSRLFERYSTLIFLNDGGGSTASFIRTKPDELGAPR